MSSSFRILSLVTLLAVSQFAHAAEPAATTAAPSEPTPAATPDAAAQASPDQAPAPSAASDVTPMPANDATPAPATDAPPPTTPQAAAAPASGVKIGPPLPGKGQIVFYRERKFVGAAISFKVREGDKELGKLSFGSYFVVSVDPGAHDYTVHSEAKDTMHMEVEAGETYYVAGSISMGFLAGRPHLAPTDQAAFDLVSAKLKVSEATP